VGWPIRVLYSFPCQWSRPGRQNIWRRVLATFCGIKEWLLVFSFSSLFCASSNLTYFHLKCTSLWSCPLKVGNMLHCHHTPFSFSKVHIRVWEQDYLFNRKWHEPGNKAKPDDLHLLSHSLKPKPALIAGVPSGPVLFCCHRHEWIPLYMAPGHWCLGASDSCSLTLRHQWIPENFGLGRDDSPLMWMIP